MAPDVWYPVITCKPRIRVNLIRVEELEKSTQDKSF